MTTGTWKDGAKRVLRRILPAAIHDPLLAAYRIARDLACDRERRREILLARPVSFLGRYPGSLYPKVLSLCLTTRCNLRCFICRREGHRARDLDFSKLPLLRNAIRNASVIDLTGWGECLLYPRFEEVVRYLYSLNGRTGLIQITTNGTMLSAGLAGLLSGRLHRLVVSLNAASAGTYNRDMRHGDFGKTMASVREFLGALNGADRGKVVFHFTAHAGNFREIPDFVRLARDMQVPAVNIGHYLVDIAEHSGFTLLNAREGYDEAVGRAEELGRELGIAVFARRFRRERPQPAFQCRDPFDSCFVEVDGMVGPCCFCGTYRIGNAFEAGFEAIWFGDGYRRLRRRRHLPACRTCNPYIPFDDPRAHFTAPFKEKAEFAAICAIYGQRGTPGGVGA